MRCKVELRPDVQWFLRMRRRNKDEIDAFYDLLERIRTDPIGNSEARSGPRLSRYMLRFARFGGNLAIFEFDPAHERIRVLECRPIVQRRVEPQAPPEREDGP